MKPTIRAAIRLKLEAEGGRHGPFNDGYCPHLVADGKEEMLGVRVIHSPQFIHPGEEREIDFELMYAPALKYRDLAIGTRFTIQEGPKVIGEGTVLAVTK